jgi:hypothetical protein
VTVGQQITVTIQGYMDIHPDDRAPMYSTFRIWVLKKNGDQVPDGYGKIHLFGGPANAPDRVVCEGFISTDDINVVQLTDDTTRVTINHTFPIEFVGDADSLCIKVDKKDVSWRPFATPATTQWGIIILVVLIVSSGVFIMLRRRKAALPA